ncbi:MAG: hypothetical protein RBS21_03600 [Corynebacterium sp.]|jgi:hypothetical protein|nr:hypothetical protein [Corynebacterium sp.]
MGDNENTHATTTKTIQGIRRTDENLMHANGAAGRAHLSRECRAGRLIRLAPAVAMPSAEWENTSWRERRRLTCLAYGLANPDLVLTGVSAARVLDIPLLDDPDAEVPELVELGRPGPSRATNVNAARIIRPLSRHGRWITVGGVRVSADIDVVHDLGRRIGPGQAMAAADHVVRERGGRGGLARGVARLLKARVAGAALTAEVVMLASDQSESAAESLTKWVIHQTGIDGWLQQVWIVGAGSMPIGRVDFFHPCLETVIQFHGKKKYDGRYGDGDTISTYENMQVRQLINVGIDVVQLTWPMVVDDSARQLVCDRAERRRRFLEVAGSQFAGEYFRDHEKLPARVRENFRSRRR